MSYPTYGGSRKFRPSDRKKKIINWKISTVVIHMNHSHSHECVVFHPSRDSKYSNSDHNKQYMSSDGIRESVSNKTESCPPHRGSRKLKTVTGKSNLSFAQSAIKSREWVMSPTSWLPRWVGNEVTWMSHVPHMIGIWLSPLRESRFPRVKGSREADTHRIPYLSRSFPTQDPYKKWLFCRKRPKKRQVSYTGWRTRIEYHIFLGHFPHKIPTRNDSFEERDLKIDKCLIRGGEHA